MGLLGRRMETEKSQQRAGKSSTQLLTRTSQHM
jgi:hypothetical protein